jgi:dihydrodipicolinate synthase/N-acetylneuraminate lyase
MSATRSLPRPLRGIIVPMVTPLASADALDVPGLERLVDRLLTGEVHGLFLLGTCGEGPSLSSRLQREMIERVCRQVAGRIPVLVGVTDSSPVQSTALARHAAEAGADAIVIAPPFYFPVEQADLLAYARQQVVDSPLPVMLYNMPGLCKVVYEPETVRRLLDEPRVIGLKDSSGDLDYFRRVRELTLGRSDWTLLIGPEHLLDEAIAFGGHGGVSGGANILPQLYVKYYEAAVAGFADEAATFESDVALLGHIYTVGAAEGITASTVVKGLKSALSILGVCSGLPCPPLAPLSAAQVEQVRQILNSVGAHRAAMAAAQQQ